MSEPKRGRGRPKTNRRVSGEGSIFYEAARNRYVGTIDLGVDDNGKRIRRKVTGPTKQDVTDRLDALRKQSEMVDLTERAPTVAQLAEQWLISWSRSGVEVGTVSVRTGRVRNHIINTWIGRLDARQMTVEHVERWLWERADTPWREATKKAPAKMRTTKSLCDLRGDLRQIMKWAVARGKVERNVVDLVPVPKSSAPKVDKRSLPPEIAAKLYDLAAKSGYRYGTYVLACLELGGRPSEIAALTWADIDHDELTVTIRQAIKRVSGGRPVALGPTKADSDRVLRMTPALSAAFKRERAVQAALQLEAGPLWSTDWPGLVYLGQLGKPPSTANLRRSFRALMNRHDALRPFADYTLYELRHSCASLLLDAGLPMEQVADVMGHDDLRMLMRHYRHRMSPVIDVAGMWQQARRVQATKSR